jgi:hypothetical protein
VAAPVRVNQPLRLEAATAKLVLFFFKRGDATLSDATALWRIVAFDSAQFHPNLKDRVIEFPNRPNFRQSDIMLHFECMIKKLLVKNESQLSSAPPVIVIDALDECGPDDSPSSHRLILLDTFIRWSRLPLSFKLIITSREHHLSRSFYDQQVTREPRNDI